MKDYKTLLGFTDQWFSLGILTEDSLQQYGMTYESSRDKNSEHYRYGAFRWYLKEHRPLSASIAEALYELGAAGPDPGMGGAIMADIVSLPECPASVSAKALASGCKHLIREAKRRSLRSELQQGPFTAELFDRCLASGDGGVHRTLFDNFRLSPEQLRQLAEQGATRAVRNMASNKLQHPTKPKAPIKD